MRYEVSSAPGLIAPPFPSAQAFAAVKSSQQMSRSSLGRSTLRGLPTFRTFFNGTAKKRFASWQEQPMGQGRSHLTRFFSVWFCMRMMWRRNMPVARSLDEKDSRSAKRGCIR